MTSSKTWPLATTLALVLLCALGAPAAADPSPPGGEARPESPSSPPDTSSTTPEPDAPPTPPPSGAVAPPADSTSDADLPPLPPWPAGSSGGADSATGGAADAGEQPRRRTLFIPPLYLRTTQGTSLTESVLPLYFHTRKTGPEGKVVATHTLFPLFHYSSDAKRKRLLTPLGGFSRWDNGDQTVVAALLVLRRRQEENRRDSIFFPLLFRTTDRRGSQTVVFPFYVGTRRFAHGGTDADVVFPLFFRVRSPHSANLVVGPFYRRVTGDGATHALFPLALYGRYPNRTTFASPLFFYDRIADRAANRDRTLSIFLPGFYHRNTAGDYQMAVFPLVWGWHRQQSMTTRFLGLPLFWHFADYKQRRVTTLALPFMYMQRADTYTYSLLPLFFYRSNPVAGSRAATLAPLFTYSGGKDHFRLLFPFAGYARSGGERYGYFLPYIGRSTPHGRFDIVFPLFWRFADRQSDTTTSVFFPLVIDRRTPESRFTSVLFPLYFHHRNIDSRTDVFFPLFLDRVSRFESRTTAVLPFFLRHHRYDTGKSSWFFPPAIWIHGHHEGTDFGLFPIFWRFSAAKRATTIFFPLLWHFRRGESRTTVVFPLYWHFARQSRDTWFVVNTYYSRGKGEHAGTYTFFFLPLFEVARKRPGDFLWEVLGGLFGYERRGHKRVARLLYFIDIPLASPTQAQTSIIGSRPARARLRDGW